MIDSAQKKSQENRYQTRAANWKDVSAIVALFNASSQNTRGTDHTAYTGLNGIGTKLVLI